MSTSSAVIDRPVVARDGETAGNGTASAAALIGEAPNGALSTERRTAVPSGNGVGGGAGSDSELAPWRAESERRNAIGNAAQPAADTALAAAPAERAPGANGGGSRAQGDPATANRSEDPAWLAGWGAGSTQDDDQRDDAQQDDGTEPVAAEVEAGTDDERRVEAETEQAVEQETEAEPAVETAEEGTPAVAATGEKRSRSRVSREERAAERSRRRQQVIVEGDEEGDAKNPSVMPLVRHLNTVTKDLALAHRTIGQVTAERDMFRRQVYQLQGLPTPEEEAEAARAKPDREARTAERAEAKESRAEAKQARAESRSAEPELSPEEMAEERRKVVWRRRAIAVGILALLTVVYVVMDQREFDWGNFSRDSFANIAYVGPIFQVFLIGFVIYRVVRVGGKAGRWLFPGDELPRKRRR